MKKEKEILLKILADHLNGRATSVENNVVFDWAEILEYARIHQIDGILYVQCKDMLPGELMGENSAKYASQVFYYINRKKILVEIEEAFTTEGIEFFMVKGMKVAEYYPVPMLRTMGDCDIVVKPKDRRKAHEIMLKLGFICGQQDEHEWVYFKNKMEFELHDHLLYEERSNYASGLQFSDEAWNYITRNEGTTMCQLDWNYHFVFLLLHLKKHILYQGAGFRQFMDLDVVAQNVKLDWGWIADKIKEQDLLDFAKICLVLCNKWFDLDIGPEVGMDIESETQLEEKTDNGVNLKLAGKISDDFYQEATEKIFGNGVFGFDDEENKKLDDYQMLVSKGKIRILLRRIFPTYDEMTRYPQYSFFLGKKYLLPFAWLYRFYRALRYGMQDRGKDLLARTFVPKEELKAKEEELRRWGIKMH